MPKPLFRMTTGVGLRLTLLATAFVAALALPAAAQVRGAPGAPYVAAKSEAVVLPFADSTMPSREIRLPAPTSDEANAIAKAQVTSVKPAPLRIGFDRAPLPADRRIYLSALPWQVEAGGALVAQLRISSSGAASLRAHIQFVGVPEHMEAQLQGTQGSMKVYAASARDLARPDGYWSPVLEGETAVVQLRVPAGEQVKGFADLLGIGHIVLATSELKTTRDIGTSDVCEVDVVCADSSPAIASVANAVTQTVLSDGAFEVLCTATLVNSAPQTNVPYLVTANHCYDENRDGTDAQVQAVANSMTTLWFFDAVSCGSDIPGPYVQVAGGATLLYRGADIDVILLRLNANPPAGAWFAAWDATPVPTNTPAIVLHHPEGDLKKISMGITQGYGNFAGAGSFIDLQYVSGSTEPGSSGAPLLTCRTTVNGACSDYAVRGALLGGSAECSNPGGTDSFSRFDLAYPYIAPWLAPNVVLPSGDGTAVEFYNVNLDHFFITSDGVEQNGIDHGSAGPGWYRTGYGFGTRPNGQGSAVCRFYGSVLPGPNSHFYTLDPAECQYLKDLQASQPATQPRWNYEGIAFWNLASGNGTCPAGMQPVYRYYNNGFPVKDSNHRFVSSLDSLQFMLDQGWTLEGVAMCAPR